jgi:hypothetical protein
MKAMKTLTLSVILAYLCIFCNAQLNVFSGNNVGIGSGVTSAAANLSINTNGANTSTLYLIPASTSVLAGINVVNLTSAAINFNGINSSLSNPGNSSVLKGVYGVAVCGTAQSTGQTFGVFGIAGNCTNGYNFGLFGRLQGTNNGAGVYGHVGTSISTVPDAQYAGFFVGNVKITGSIWAQSGTITGSDIKLKKNISNIDSTEKILGLKPLKYNLKGPLELIDSSILKSDTAKISLSQLPEPEYAKKLHYGFAAQDVQKIYPELVYQSGDGTLGVDYQGFIPIIIDQLKKMKKSLDEKDARIAILEKKLQALQTGQ